MSFIISPSPDIVLVRTIEEKLLWCFKLYDTDNSGVIDRQEMGNIMEVRPDLTSAVLVGTIILYFSLSTACWRPSTLGLKTIPRRELRGSSPRSM